MIFLTPKIGVINLKSLFRLTLVQLIGRQRRSGPKGPSRSILVVKSSGDYPPGRSAPIASKNLTSLADAVALASYDTQPHGRFRLLIDWSTHCAIVRVALIRPKQADR